MKRHALTIIAAFSTPISTASPLGLTVSIFFFEAMKLGELVATEKRSP